VIAALLPTLALSAGISPYLPVELPAAQSRQIDLLFALADEPVLRRPVSLAAVDDAMARACPRDPSLCEVMEPWLARYREPGAVTTLRAEAALADTTSVSMPNRHGLRTDNAWQLAVAAHWQPSPYWVLGAGAMARPGEIVPSGTVLSAGNRYARVDVGFQERWASPLPDSAFLQSAQAATMASITVSNDQPISRARLRYELQLSRMSWTGRISDGGTLTQGHPLLAGLHLSVQPAPGWSLGAARQLQYGGGSRDARAISLLKAFFAPNHYDNFRDGRPEEFGNQQAAWSSSFIYPGATPLVVSMEYAGEDTSHGTPGRLGNSGLTLGINAPRLWRNAGMRFEISEWQNSWYAHHLYADGMTHRGQVIGHWGAAWRAPMDDVGGHSQSLALQWNLGRGRSLDLRWRTLVNQSYSQASYRRANEFGASFGLPLGRLHAGTELLLGRDVFGDRYYRFAAFARLGEAAPGPVDAVGSVGNDEASAFVDVGAALNRTRASRDKPGSATRRAVQFSPHLGVGLRRAVWTRSDLGVRLELGRVEEHSLIALRALDYRYRLGPSLSLTGFFGAARLGTATPAYGYYAGGGLQWRDVRPRWDVGLELRYGDKMASDDLAPDGTLLGNSDTFTDLSGVALYLSRRF
jgi:Capsule assembly protein Wzi